MTRKRFVLFHRDGAPPSEELLVLKETPGLEILEDSGRALLVLATPEAVLELRRALPGWAISEEHEHRAPSPHLPRIERDPDWPS